MKELASIPIEIWLVIMAVIFAIGAAAFVILGGTIMRSLRELRGDGEKREITNQPLKVQKHEDCVPKDQFENFGAANTAEHGQLHSRIGAVDRSAAAKIDALKDSLVEMERRIISASNLGDQNIHERINELQESVGELRGEVKQIDKHQS